MRAKMTSKANKSSLNKPRPLRASRKRKEQMRSIIGENWREKERVKNRKK